VDTDVGGQSNLRKKNCGSEAKFPAYMIKEPKAKKARDFTGVTRDGG
jgi:hypothetical protein